MLDSKYYLTYDYEVTGNFYMIKADGERKNFCCSPIDQTNTSLMSWETVTIDRVCEQAIIYTASPDELDELIEKFKSIKIKII